MSEQHYSEWCSWGEAPHFSLAGFEETLDGGQAFRWNRQDSHFEGRWGKTAIRLRHIDGAVEYSAPTDCESSEAQQALAEYFALETDFGKLTNELPWRSDPVLKASIDAFPGLRILRQPLAETLLCFLCSSTKQIPQIKAICEAVATDLGHPLPDGTHGLPNWNRIAAAGEGSLRSAKLGYRARYIFQTACFMRDHTDYIAQVDAAPTDQARELLIALPGVGRKIADCVLLFGAGRMDAFPIDTWVQKILTRAYGLDGWKADQLLDFARVHFGPSAGLAQQYLFAAARAGIIAR